MEANLTRRRYDLDWLRVLAFAGVFFYHCARFFNSSDWHNEANPAKLALARLTGRVIAPLVVE